jgi:hypothetical protein
MLRVAALRHRMGSDSVFVAAAAYRTWALAFCPLCFCRVREPLPRFDKMDRGGGAGAALARGPLLACLRVPSCHSGKERWLIASDYRGSQITLKIFPSRSSAKWVDLDVTSKGGRTRRSSWLRREVSSSPFAGPFVSLHPSSSSVIICHVSLSVGLPSRPPVRISADFSGRPLSLTPPSVRAVVSLLPHSRHIRLLHAYSLASPQISDPEHPLLYQGQRLPAPLLQRAPRR